MSAAFAHNEEAELSRPTAVREHHQELLERHGAMVWRVAQRVMASLPPGRAMLEVSEFYHVGLIALFGAEKNYDPTRGQSFETFSEFRVRGAMLDELRRQDFFPRRLRQKANRYKKTVKGLQEKLGRAPTDEEIAGELKISMRKFQSLRQAIQPYNFVPDSAPHLQLTSAQPSPFTICVEREKRELVKQAITQLSEREQYVIDLYYRRELTLREIAEILELTEGRISQIKSAAVKKLRGILERA